MTRHIKVVFQERQERLAVKRLLQATNVEPYLL